jgi:hypothetical protein
LRNEFNQAVSPIRRLLIHKTFSPRSVKLIQRLASEGTIEATEFTEKEPLPLNDQMKAKYYLLLLGGLCVLCGPDFLN